MEKAPDSVRFNLDMVFQRVQNLGEFNIIRADGQPVKALGKDYFVVNPETGILERYTIHIHTDVAQLREYMNQNRLYIFDRLVDAKIDLERVIKCVWSDPDENLQM
jgi:hypothetical protein